MTTTNSAHRRIRGRTSPPLAHRSASLRGARRRGQGVDKSGCARFSTHTNRSWACPVDFGAKTLGCTAAWGIFFYDGTNRVSVWDVLGVFVGLQLLMIVGFACAARSPDTRRASIAALTLWVARQAVHAIQRMLPEAGHGYRRVHEVLDNAPHPEHPCSAVVKWLARPSPISDFNVLVL